ncbi:unnamed protein product [Polarella glacialis]|uniref:Beta-glucosidase n=1 Tax=Polarella glacialis TaxID=89957 RepID=A0A813HTA8_POLGL|nr:unnamed protein product [Polarella glacialis]
MRKGALAAALPGAVAHSFVFGTASSAFQYEGAASVDGRGDTIWDDFCRLPAGRCNGQVADVAVDQYNLTRFAEDVRLMQELGTTAYRLSLAWSRLMPSGNGQVSRQGLQHYQQVLQLLRDGGIEPFVTLFHYDLPSALEDRYGGWLNSSTVDSFVEYADLCFREFGSLVREWATINEPHSIATGGYLYGVAAPGRCSNRSQCAAGDGLREPYLAGHNLLLAHGRAVELYRRAYQAKQGGRIAMVISGDHTEPFSSSATDAAAAQRRQEFQIGWFADPLFFGDYPESMQRAVGSRLPCFSDAERSMLKDSWDYFAINHYTSRYARGPPLEDCHGSASFKSKGWDDDQCCNVTPFGPDGSPIGPQAGSDWLLSVPWGLRRLLRWISTRYDAPPIFITENGCDDVAGQGLDDSFRVEYLASYLAAMKEAMQDDGVDVRGYFVWSLLDNFEWSNGFHKRFGVYQVDDEGPDATLRRTAKRSVGWLKEFISRWAQPRNGSGSARGAEAGTKAAGVVNTEGEGAAETMTLLTTVI